MIDTVNNLNWTVKNVRERIKLITKIIERAENMELKFDKMTLRMDLRFVDESIGLRLEDFLVELTMVLYMTFLEFRRISTVNKISNYYEFYPMI